MGGKSRIKERTIQEVIQKVSLWRLLYTGFHKNGVYVKMSLEEAAQKVKISKKSLDDYLMQLRSAKKFGFDFESNSHEKVGKIRSFVKKKKEEERARLNQIKGPGNRQAADSEKSKAANAPMTRKLRSKRDTFKP
jgi:hypothetical protein